jgi:RNA polymerase sigma factor (sigma-70 family)
MLPVQPSQTIAHRPGLFATTHWSVVLAARDAQGEAAEKALSQLCSIYWYPLYAFVRRRGFNPHDAEDLTQEFFCRLLDKNYLSSVDYRKGRFRTFLLTALENFLRGEWRRARAKKRGGGLRLISLDDPDAEARYSREPASGQTPERIYERNCALALLEQTLRRLREEAESEGKGGRFDRLKGFLTADGERRGYAELAQQLGTSEAALKMAVNRLRQRYGELLRDTIAQTIASQDQVDEELRSLFMALEA